MDVRQCDDASMWRFVRKCPYSTPRLCDQSMARRMDNRCSVCSFSQTLHSSASGLTQSTPTISMVCISLYHLLNYRDYVGALAGWLRVGEVKWRVTRMAAVPTSTSKDGPILSLKARHASSMGMLCLGTQNGNGWEWSLLMIPTMLSSHLQTLTPSLTRSTLLSYRDLTVHILAPQGLSKVESGPKFRWNGGILLYCIDIGSVKTLWRLSCNCLSTFFRTFRYSIVVVSSQSPVLFWSEDVSHSLSVAKPSQRLFWKNCRM
jgi:hypothetical protein